MKKRIVSLLLVLAMTLSLVPFSAFSAGRDETKAQVHVTVENNTFSVDDGAPWAGTLVDTWVEIDESSTMMSCVGAALEEAGLTAEGLDSGYISSVYGLADFDGGTMSGWMGTLNDWFTNNGFDHYTVADGTLEAGDEIAILYSCDYGADLGSDWSSNDTSLKALSFSKGTLSPAFASEALEYTLALPAGTEGIVVTPTATNKKFQVHIKVGQTEYKRAATVPVTDGTVLTLEVGTGESMNSGATPTTYTVTIDLPDAVDPSVGADWPSFRGNSQNNGVTSAATPRSAEETELKWAVKHSTGCPNPMLIVDNSLVVLYGNSIKKLSLETGEVLASSQMCASTSWGSVPAAYADGIIFCPLGGGTVQAFNAKTLEPLWSYADALGGQAQSPIACADGKIYVGFGYNGEYAFVCLDAADGSLVWRQTDEKGYYWAGAVVAGDYVICGSDSGHLCSRNKDTGAVISDLTVGSGSIRSTVCYEDGKVYFTLNNASLCRATLDAETGVLSDLTVKDCSAYGSASTSTPVVYGGIVYIGVGGWSGSKNVIAVDADTMEILWSVEEPAYPQCSILLSTAYEASGYVYLYVTYNANPGGINVIKAKTDGSEAVQTTLYNAVGYEQFCICSVIAGSDGTLYYKNDSSNVFALGLTQAAKDQLAADAVIGLISAIGTVTLESETVIGSARTAYDALTDAQKALVTNYDVLTAAEARLAALKADKSAADAVIELIDAISTVTLSSGPAIEAARTAYDTLTDAQKALVTNYDVLTAAEARLEALKADKSAADTVIGLIDAIGTVTLSSGPAIEAARAAYDALTDAQKALVTNYDVLTAAEARLEELKDENTTVPVEVYVTVSNAGSVVMAQEKIVVTDRNDNGFFDVDDALWAAHEAAYPGGAAEGYGSANGSYGLYITTLWGDTSGAFGYWLNNASCWSLADVVEDGDHLVAFVYQDGVTYSDAYTKFDSFIYAATTDAAFTVTLEQAGYDESWNTVFTALAGAELLAFDAEMKAVDSTGYAFTELGNGSYSVNFTETGSYYLIAASSDTLIVPAVCKVAVGANADKDAADTVTALIDAIGTVTLESETAISAARTAYDALTDVQKALVTNYDVLTAAEAKLAALKADRSAADAVTALIDAIGTVTAESETAISAARTAYDALTDAQKALVTNYDVLTAAEAKLAALKADRSAADAVTALIDAIGTVTAESETAISAARTAYDALTDAQKALVTNYDVLTAAEAKLAALKADRSAADAVTALIDAIGTVTAESETAISAARTAYDALTDAQKALVTNYDVLTAAEAKLAALKADRSAADAVTAFINAIGIVTLESETAISAARTAYDALTDAQKVLVTNYDVLTEAEALLAILKLPHADVETIYQATGSYLEALSAEHTPTVGSVGGDWIIIGLARSGRDVPDAYYDNVVDYVKQNINDAEQLHRSKSTDNSRVILALTAMGKDVTDVDGHDLLQGLTDMAYLTKQGINGPVWALIAFDSGKYEIPAAHEGAKQVTREELIAYILSAQLEDGGWALSGDVGDPDMTAMALQALAPYYDTDEAVAAVVDAALKALSDAQQEDGGFGSGGTANSESAAQVIVALAALDIDPNTDERFVKNGRSVIDALCGYYVDGGGFRHLSDGERDGMATEQGYYALAAYYRFLGGQTSLYDMSDVTIETPEVPFVNPYTDVNETDWFYEAVKYTSVNGLMNGMGKDTFEPQTEMTRAMLVTVLYRAEGSPNVTGLENPFKDVDESWYTDAVCWAAANQIVNGVSDGVFAPDNPVTREQMVTILYRYTNYKGKVSEARADLDSFPDADQVRSYAKEAMRWAVAEEIIQGSAEGGKTYILPANSATRAEIATVLMRFVEKFGE